MFCAHGPAPYFTLISGVFPLHQIANVRVSRSMNLKLNRREIIFSSIPIYVITVPEHYRRTERFGRSRSSRVIDFGANRKRVIFMLPISLS